MAKTSLLHNTIGLYLLFITLIFAFVTYPGSTEAAEDPVVWYFDGMPIYFATFVTLAFFVIICLTYKFKPDKVETWLLARVFICGVPAIYIYSLSSFSAHYPVVILSLLAYCIGRSSSWKYERQTGMIIILFGLILSIQVIQTFQTIDTPFLHLDYKRYMRIPIAASNVIAAYLVPIFFLYLFNYKRGRILNLVLITLFIAAILLTKSRGGVSVLLLTFIVYLVFFKFKLNLFYVITLFVLLYIIISYLFEIPEVKLFMLGFSADSTSFDANSLSSNRLEIYAEEFQRFLAHPLFGNGMVFNSQTSHTGSHNFFIELLVQSGIFGTISYIIPICIVLKHAIQFKSSPHVMGWILFLIATLLHGLIEVNFFNYSTDIIFWSVCGMLMTCKNSNNEIKRSPPLARVV